MSQIQIDFIASDFAEHPNFGSSTDCSLATAIKRCTGDEFASCAFTSAYINKKRYYMAPFLKEQYEYIKNMFKYYSESKFSWILTEKSEEFHAAQRQMTIETSRV